MKKHFGIIGNPISHSLSPVLHQYWFKKYDIDADYSIIESTNENLSSVITLKAPYSKKIFFKMNIDLEANSFFEISKNLQKSSE